MQLAVDPAKKDDFNYRYKMPPVTIKGEGSGNGVKTVIENLGEIATSLKRPPGSLLKFIGTSLGTMPEDKFNKLLVMGTYSNEKIQDKIYDFIKYFVLCSADDCRNPETTLVPGGGGRKLLLHCNACGREREVAATNSVLMKCSENLLRYAKEHKQDTKGTAAAGKGTAAADDNGDESGEHRSEIDDREDEGLQNDLKAEADRAKAKLDYISILYDVLSDTSSTLKSKQDTLVRIKAEAVKQEDDAIRLLMRALFLPVKGALTGQGQQAQPPTTTPVIGPLRDCIPMLQLLLTDEPATRLRRIAVLTFEIDFNCMSTKVAFRIPMIYKMLVEEEVLQPEIVSDWLTKSPVKASPALPAAAIEGARQEVAPTMTLLRSWFGITDVVVDSEEAAAGEGSGQPQHRAASSAAAAEETSASSAGGKKGGKGKKKVAAE